MGVDRRRFLRNGLLFNATLVSAAMLPADGAAGAGKAAPAKVFALDEITIDTLQERFASGTLTATAVVDAYLARIKAIDAAGPTVKSVLELNPDARAIARELDRE